MAFFAREKASADHRSHACWRRTSRQRNMAAVLREREDNNSPSRLTQRKQAARRARRDAQWRRRQQNGKNQRNSTRRDGVRRRAHLRHQTAAAYGGDDVRRYLRKTSCVCTAHPLFWALFTLFSRAFPAAICIDSAVNGVCTLFLAIFGTQQRVIFPGVSAEVISRCITLGALRAFSAHYPLSHALRFSSLHFPRRRSGRRLIVYRWRFSAQNILPAPSRRRC